MKMQVDLSKTYAIALEGGGARGAYEVGVWKALAEAGVRYDAVAGTSVGALNGAMMVMGKLEEAVRLWETIRFSKVLDVDDAQMHRLYHGTLQGADLRDFLKSCIDIVRDGGLDSEPLRRLLEAEIDEERIRRSAVAFFLVTYSLTDRREVEVSAQDLESGRLRDMLLASAYLPIFRRKKLDGKSYLDGSVQNILPLDSLLKRGYRDIIAIRIYGIGVEKRTKIPADANILTIAPTEKLGGILQFDAESTRRDLQRGYFDGQRALYGLAGERYYIDRRWDERRAYLVLKLLTERSAEAPMTLRELHEKHLPRLAKKYKAKTGDYHDLLLHCMEEWAEQAGVSPFAVRTEEGLLRAIFAAWKEKGYPTGFCI